MEKLINYDLIKDLPENDDGIVIPIYFNIFSGSLVALNPSEDWARQAQHSMRYIPKGTKKISHKDFRKAFTNIY